MSAVIVCGCVLVVAVCLAFYLQGMIVRSRDRLGFTLTGFASVPRLQSARVFPAILITIRNTFLFNLLLAFLLF